MTLTKAQISLMKDMDKWLNSYNPDEPIETILSELPDGVRSKVDINEIKEMTIKYTHAMLVKIYINRCYDDDSRPKLNALRNLYLLVRRTNKQGV